MINYIIVDDEPIAHRIIEGYCENLKHLNKKHNCFNVFEAIDFLSKERIDLMFLDINMPEISGFEFLKTLKHSPKVIVTTAYKEFALEGYELNISDYLLKPFSLSRFLTAVNKTIEHPQLQGEKLLTTDNNDNSYFFVKGDKKHHQLEIKSICYIEACGNYSKIYLENNSILTHEKISSFEEKLPNSQFIRVHKSFIIGLNKINVIEGNKVIIGNYTVPIGQTYKSKMMELIRKNN